MPDWTLPVALLLGYLLGSVPFGLVLTRAAGLGDIRRIGSGNIGATNVLRTGRKGLALATLLLDGGKGAAAVLLAGWWPGPEAAVAAGAGAMLGHIFPLWLGFRGGKGVATALGTLLAALPAVGILCCLVWLAMARLFRFSSLAALVAIATAPLAALAFALFPLGPGASADGPRVALALLIATLVFMRHRDNVRRLVAGTEPRIGDRKSG
jgi:glycerol-3-phosphate acyltransferase PlsY